MNKTNPIGVRFRADLLEKLKAEHGIESPQKALIFYERFFVAHSGYVRDVKSPLRDGVEKPKNRISDELGKSTNLHEKAKDEVYDAPPLPKSVKDEYLKVGVVKPKTLDELRALCPAEITDKIERGNWLGLERQKYGI